MNYMTEIKQGALIINRIDSTRDLKILDLSVHLKGFIIFLK